MNSCTIDALRGFNPADEPKAGARTERETGFAQLLNRIIDGSKSLAPEKTARVQPIKKADRQSERACAHDANRVTAGQTEKPVKKEDAKQHRAGQSERDADRVTARQAEKPDKEEDAKQTRAGQSERACERDADRVTDGQAEAPDKKGDANETRAGQILAEINREIVKTLSGMLLISPEQILTVMAQMNIEPLTLTEQAVMELFLSTLQSVTPIQTQNKPQPPGAPLPDLTADNAKETADAAIASDDFIPAEQIETRPTGDSAPMLEITPERLTAAVINIVRRAGTDPLVFEAEENPAPEAAPEAPSEDASVIIPDRDAPEPGQDEYIGESWHSDDSDMPIESNPEKPGTDIPAFTLPQTDAPAARAADSAASIGAPGAPRPEAGKNINLNEVIRQVADGIQAQTLGGGVSELKLTLKPESLGEVALKLLSDNGIVTARFTAENQRIKEIIESNFSVLRESLTEQGISVNQLSVSVGQRDAQERRFVRRERHFPVKIIESVTLASDAAPPLAAHDSRVSYTA